eukprot:11210218-Lingulodinium_polyedra.AAC.1
MSIAARPAGRSSSSVAQAPAGWLAQSLQMGPPPRVSRSPAASRRTPPSPTSPTSSSSGCD